MVALITLFAVPPDGDDAFLADRRRACDAAGDVVLLRALRADVAFRFVEVAPAQSAGPAGEASPWTAQAALFDVVHEDGAPDGGEGVAVIDACEAGAPDDERYLAGWRRLRDSLADRPGYLGTRLHRRADRAAGIRFVTVTRWSSPLAHARAMREPGPSAADAESAYRCHRALYLLISDSRR